MYTHNPDVIAVQEILPKNISDIIAESIFNIDGYEHFTNEKQGWKRGVVLYIRKGMGASELNWSNKFEESIWVEIKLRGGDKLIIGCIYCSQNSKSENNEKFLTLITEVTDKNPSHLQIAGDCNYPEIDWKNNSSPDNLNNNNNKFLNCSKDSFLYQHILEHTHFRPGFNPSTIDIILTNEEAIVQNIEYLAPLGFSHHVMLKFKFNCYHVFNEYSQPKFKYDKADFKSMREDLKSVIWELELEGLDSVQTWDVIGKKLNALIDIHVPKSKCNITKSSRKPLWLNENAYCKARKQKKCHDRYRQTLQGKDYGEYTWARNQAKWACKKAIRTLRN